MTDSSVIVARVAVDNVLYHFDKLYDYLIPDDMMQYALPGCRVMVQFGGSVRQGIITEIAQTEKNQKLKPLRAITDKAPILNNEMLGLALFIKDRYFCTMYDAVRVMLPWGLGLKRNVTYKLNDSYNNENESSLSVDEQQIIQYLIKNPKGVKEENILQAMGYTDNSILTRLVKNNILLKVDSLKRNMKDTSVKMVALCDENGKYKFSPKQKEVYEVLCACGCASVKEICYFTGVTSVVIDGLVKKGAAFYYEAEPPQKKNDNINKTVPEIVLTPKQNEVYKNLYAQYSNGKASVSLLYGITGSGKTSVFMKLIDDITAKGKGVIVTVPEIALTPQLLKLFTTRYGDNTAIFHSGLSLGKRLEEWKRVKKGEAKIAIGTRSAIFAPMENIGLIVMDEEQESSYKSSSSPRFHARDLAKYRCKYNNCMLLLASATPSVESFYCAKNGIYSFNRLDERYGKAILPNVEVVDMNIETENGNMGEFSSRLLEAIESNLKNGKQSIILLNRRGYNTFVSCRECREVYSCPNCSISVTYHSANGRMMCHYCGFSAPLASECPVCHSKKLRYSGTGTQRAETDLQSIFPEAKILRLDADATMTKYSHERLLGDFSDGKYDIMIGTQMVAKGLDFPNVTLVGVLSADHILFGDDFRSYERAFSLITQVVGRSGRGNERGIAIIQTHTPDNNIIRLASMQNYDEFYSGEINLRKLLLYPPFVDLCLIGFVGKECELTEKAAKFFLSFTVNLLKEKYSDLPIRILGPSPASVLKINNKYRYKLIFKIKNNKKSRLMISEVLTEFGKKKDFKDVTAYIDINPDNIL